MASISTNQMRMAILSVYPNSSRWAHRVDNMRPIQIYAVYRKFEKEGRFDRSRKEDDYHQLTLFELGMKDG